MANLTLKIGPFRFESRWLEKKKQEFVKKVPFFIIAYFSLSHRNIFIIDLKHKYIINTMLHSDLTSQQPMSSKLKYMVWFLLHN